MLPKTSRDEKKIFIKILLEVSGRNEQTMWFMEVKALLELIDLILIYEHFYGPKIVVS